MNRRTPRTILVSALLVLLCCLFPSLGAAAESGDSYTITLPVSQQFINREDGIEVLYNVFDYTLEPVTDGAPLPSLAQDGVYRFSLEGDDQINIPLVFSGQTDREDAICFTQPGIYEYRLRQSVTKPRENYHYDKQSYYIKICAENFNGKTVFSWIEAKDSNGLKPDLLEFTNYYQMDSEEHSQIDEPTEPESSPGGSYPDESDEPVSTVSEWGEISGESASPQDPGGEQTSVASAPAGTDVSKNDETSQTGEISQMFLLMFITLISVFGIYLFVQIRSKSRYDD